MKRLISTRDLLPSELRFVAELRALAFGRIERIRIQNGELLLNPRSAFIRDIKFGSKEEGGTKPSVPKEFALKNQVIEFFTYVRSVSSGEIHSLEIRDGIPIFARVETRPTSQEGDRP